jgi:hypothetical protein
MPSSRSIMRAEGMPFAGTVAMRARTFGTKVAQDDAYFPQPVLWFVNLRASATRLNNRSIPPLPEILSYSYHVVAAPWSVGTEVG